MEDFKHRGSHFLNYICFQKWDMKQEIDEKYIFKEVLTLENEIMHYSQITKNNNGARGYYCLSCRGEMQAIFSTRDGVPSYFRHNARDVTKGELECTYSNDDFRHKESITILNRIKQIRVPPLYKCSPDKTSKMWIQDARNIECEYTKAELTFYETEEGNLEWGKNPDVKDRYNVVRPDVTFFDSNDRPVLFVEVVVTHKADEIKRDKLKILGIDTVEVYIPKKSLKDIEKQLKTSSKNTFWIFNNEESQTTYIQNSSRTSSTMDESDERQRDLLEESFSCRSQKIGNLIRKLSKLSKSTEFKNAEEGFSSELQRVGRNIERERELRKGIQDEVRNGFRKEEEGVQERRTRVEERYRELEERYLKKRGGIEAELIRFNAYRKAGQSRIREEVDERYREYRRDLEEECESFKQEEDQIDIEIKDIDRKIKRVIGEIRNLKGGSTFVSI